MELYRQSVVYSPQPREYRRHSPHLPTPGTSRSSNGSLDEQIPRTYTRNGMRICSLLTNDQPDRVTKPLDRTYNGVTGHSDSRHRSAPQSPPYHDLDSHKPSLPPLKTVLNGTITSPPNTPPTQQRLFQPGPREPAFSACTYKPPALYPNKKPRTEGGLDPSPTFQPRSSLSSPGAPTAHVDERREPFYEAPTLRQEHTYPGTSNYHHSRGIVDDARSRSGAKTANGSYRSPEMATYPSTRTDYSSSSRMRPSADYFASSSTDRYALPSERSFVESRPSGVNAPHPLDAPRAVYPPSGSSQYSLPLREDSGAPKEQSHYADRGRLHAPDVYNRMSYEDAQPTFFMPSHYDYQQGKTRKRSNLPKQSTEIMKTWFDQNITNPYPSEDQKAVFSNATGISMTQVSNWFINHRRRCPELRDKRDKTRVGGLDGGD